MPVYTYMGNADPGNRVQIITIYSRDLTVRVGQSADFTLEEISDLSSWGYILAAGQLGPLQPPGPDDLDPSAIEARVDVLEADLLSVESDGGPVKLQGAQTVTGPKSFVPAVSSDVPITVRKGTTGEMAQLLNSDGSVAFSVNHARALLRKVSGDGTVAPEIHLAALNGYGPLGEAWLIGIDVAADVKSRDIAISKFRSGGGVADALYGAHRGLLQFCWGMGVTEPAMATSATQIGKLQVAPEMDGQGHPQPFTAPVPVFDRDKFGEAFDAISEARDNAIGTPEKH